MAPVLPTLRRVATVLGALCAVGLFSSAPALATAATTDIHLNPGQKGKTATSFENSCDQVPGGRRAGLDGWVFVLPGNAGTLVSLDITFNNGTRDVHVHIVDPRSPYPNGIATNGSDKAYVVVPAGWTVVDGTGKAQNAKGDKFNVTHVCRGGGGIKESTPAESAGSGGSVSGGGNGNGNGTGTGGNGTAGGGSLPITGTAVGGLIAAGLGLVGAGATLLVLRRRRDTLTFEA
jgi:LPXTG-motif cell wall-anchored protein